MELRAIIGLEIHVEMNTKSKMFSDAPVSFGQLPNTQVSAFDMSFPGTMPTVNKQAVINAIRVSNALNMTIDNVLMFDRKNYFYSDLPKGYQITQYYRPIGRNGCLTFNSGDENITINIERLHLEEDTCKQFHVDDFSYLDFNRAGIPVIEIVTKPEFKSGQEVRKFVELIRSIVVFLDVSHGKMEEGNIRVDLNVSLEDDNKRWSKVEIKNLNSLSNIEKAINYEVNRQKDLVIKGKTIGRETRRYDETNDRTVMLRIKTDSVDYRYFTDPNIPPIKLSDEFIKNAIDTSPESDMSSLVIGKGVGIKISDSVFVSSPDLVDWMRKISDKNNILYQMEVSDCGTNELIISNEHDSGYKELGISIPCQYPHTANTVVAKNDIQECKKLLSRIIAGL